MLYGLNGLGCNECGNTCGGANGFGAVADYDQIRIGGGTYSANQIVGKTILANKDTTLYSNPSGGGRVVGMVKAGQQIGVVFSYIKPTDKTSDGRSWLQFDNSYLNSFFIPDENASASGLKDQGTKTVAEEIKDEADKALKDDSPVEYYIKKYALKTILVIGTIIIVGGIAKEAVKGAINKKTVTE